MADTGFNLEQFRSELADEAQLVATLPEGARVKSLRDKAYREQGQPKPRQDGEIRSPDDQPNGTDRS